MPVPSVSAGKTTTPGKGVADGSAVAVDVGSGVNVGGMGEAVRVGGTGVGDAGMATGVHPLTKTVSRTSARNLESTNVYMMALLLIVTRPTMQRL